MLVGLAAALALLLLPYIFSALRSMVTRDPLMSVVHASGSYCGPLQLHLDPEIVSKRPSLDGSVVVYKGACVWLWGQRDLVYGWVRVDEDGIHRGAWSRAQQLPAGELAEYGGSSACTGPVCFHGSTMVRVLSPEVAVVEAVYGDGRVDRAEPVGGFFASVGTSEMRELRFLGADGKLLRSVPM